ncbi:hypothetical protein ABE527_02550 [Brucella sp. TWI432]
MTDPRKTVVRPSAQGQVQILKDVEDLLLEATAAAAQRLGMSGASFVMIGMGVWAAELAEVNGPSSAKFIRALGTIFDPDASPMQKEAAEVERSKALHEIYATVDMLTSTPAGRA